MKNTPQHDTTDQRVSTYDTLSVQLPPAGWQSRKASSHSSDECFADFAFEASDRDGRNSPQLAPENLQSNGWTSMHLAAQQHVMREFRLRTISQMSVGVAAEVKMPSLEEEYQDPQLEIPAHDVRVSESPDNNSTSRVENVVLSARDMRLEVHLDYPISLNVSPRIQGRDPQFATVSLPHLQIDNSEARLHINSPKAHLTINATDGPLRVGGDHGTAAVELRSSVAIQISTTDPVSEINLASTATGAIDEMTEVKAIHKSSKDERPSALNPAKLIRSAFRMDMMANRNRTKTDFKTDTGGSNLKLTDALSAKQPAEEGNLPDSKKPVSAERSKIRRTVTARITQAIYPSTNNNANVTLNTSVIGSANRRDRLLMEAKGHKQLVHSIVNSIRANATPKRRKLNKNDSKINESQDISEGDKLNGSKNNYSKRYTKLQNHSHSRNAPQFIRDIVTKVRGSSQLRTGDKNTSSNASVKRSSTREEKPARSDRIRLQELLVRLSKLYPTSLGLAYDTAAEILTFIQHTKAFILMDAPLPKGLVAAVMSVTCLLGLTVSASIGKIARVQNLAKELVCGFNTAGFDFFSSEGDSSVECKTALSKLRLM